MDRALVVGGTQFIGRHTVTELLTAGYEVTICNRGRTENPFEDRTGVEHVETDRTERSDLERARDVVDPEVVIDCVAYHPEEVRVATEVFADVEAYVYVSSGSAYGTQRIPHREGESPLAECTPEQAVDDSPDTYGPRKAEGDRIVFEAADRGVNATAVRPMVVYGPHDYTGRLDYWIDRVVEYDQVLVPGDGDSLLHRAYVEDVARALRVVAEEGTPGEAYNVADRRLVTLQESLELVADAAGTEIEVVTASERELAQVDLSPGAFPLYTPYPLVVDTGKLSGLNWESTPLDDAIGRTVDHHLATDESPGDVGPSREQTERALRHLL